MREVKIEPGLWLLGDYYAMRCGSSGWNSWWEVWPKGLPMHGNVVDRFPTLTHARHWVAEH